MPTSHTSTPVNLIPNDIEDAARECIQQFRVCSKLPHLKQDEWVENRLADFNFWCASTGALAPSKASLDYRLEIANETKIRSIILQLLQLLRIVLQNTEVTGGGENPSQHTSISDLRIATSDVDSIIEQLGGLAIAIRRSGSSSAILKADRTFHPNMHQELHHHLTLLIVLEQVKCRLRSSSPIGDHLQISIETPLSSVQKRLIDANLRRRHRFVYAQNHALKLERQDAGHEFSIYDSSDSDVKTNDIIGIAIEGQRRPSSKQAASRLNKDTVTITTASAVAVPIENLMPAKLTPSQRAKTEISTTGSKIVYPAPPEVEMASALFRCPCCCLPQPSEIARPLRRNRWRNHLAEDLRPYVCVLESCQSPEAMYITRQAWVEHMENDHPGLKAWQCIICEVAEPFLSEGGFLLHLSKDHSGAVEDVETFAAACEHYISPTIESCPLCSWAEDQTGPVAPSALLDHLAEHVHSFSLRSLPWPSSAGSVGQDLLDEAKSEIHDWLLGIPEEAENESPSDVIEISNIETAVEILQADVAAHTNSHLASALGSVGRAPVQQSWERKIDYFANHEYFDEDEVDSVQALVQSDIGSCISPILDDGIPVYHQSVSALLIYWKSHPDSSSDWIAEILALSNVLRRDYRFTVHLLELDPSEGNATMQLHEYIVECLRETFNKDALLIVYYGGLAFIDDETGDHRLTAAAIPTESAETISWGEVQEVFSYIEVDLLFIFNCNLASEIADIILLNPPSLSTVCEVVAYSSTDVTFTIELIFALKRLAGIPYGFLAPELSENMTASSNFAGYPDTPLLVRRVRNERNPRSLVFHALSLSPTVDEDYYNHGIILFDCALPSDNGRRNEGPLFVAELSRGDEVIILDDAVPKDPDESERRNWFSFSHHSVERLDGGVRGVVSGRAIFITGQMIKSAGADRESPSSSGSESEIGVSSLEFIGSVSD